jgi:hypothetical protein
VVGCDGGRSSVRKLSGFEFPGLDAKTIGRIARLELADPAAFPMPVRGPQGSLQHGGLRDGWVRVRLSEPTDRPERGDREPVTVEEVHDALQRVTGVDVAITLQAWFGPQAKGQTTRCRDALANAALLLTRRPLPARWGEIRPAVLQLQSRDV